MSGKHWRGLAPALAATIGLGCGSEEAPRAGVTERMEAPARKLVREETADPSNLSPVVELVRLEPAEPIAGEPVSAEVESSDPENDRVRYAYTWRLEGERMPGSGPRVELPRSERGDRLELIVIATDGHSESEPFLVSTWIKNRPPRLTGLRIEPANNVTAGTEISATPAADDPDGDPLTFRYRWTVNGERARTSGPLLETARLRRGDSIQVWAVANDGEDDSESIESPVITVANAPPYITSKPAGTGADGVFRYEVEAEDLDRDRTLRYRLEGEPDGMSVEALSGLVTWRPNESQSGTHSVVVIVDDLQGGIGRQTFEVTVGVEEVAPPAAPDAPTEQ